MSFSEGAGSPRIPSASIARVKSEIPDENGPAENALAKRPAAGPSRRRAWRLRLRLVRRWWTPPPRQFRDEDEEWSWAIK